MSVTDLLLGKTFGQIAVERKRAHPDEFAWEEESHPRDERGRFTDGDSDEQMAIAYSKIAEASDAEWGWPDGNGWGSTDEWMHEEWVQRHMDAVYAFPQEVQHLAEQAVIAWSSGQVDTLRDPNDDGARAVLDVIAAGESEDVLYRGLELPDKEFLDMFIEPNEGFTDQRIKVGDEFSADIASWTSSPSVAEVFTSARWTEHTNPVKLELEPGAHSLPIAALGREEYAWQHEVLVNDKLVVTDITHDENGVPLIRLRADHG